MNLIAQLEAEQVATLSKDIPAFDGLANRCVST
jgi:hypothetical protein